jgi:hypothetical protein
VIALVGLGGAGKTAIAAHFVGELCSAPHSPHPDGLFEWSFYQEPDVGRFLSAAYRYFVIDESSATPAKGAGLLHLLRDALMTGGRHLLVLDGLERVQRQESHQPGLFGQIEDPLLRGLLTRVGEGAGQTVALVTSRFPLSDLRPFLNHGYRHLDIEGLSPRAAVSLLRGHGVQGDDATLEELAQSYGAHALSLDHLGGLIGHFLGGDPARAPEAPKLTSPGEDRQALRLARLLQAYETHLPPAELALLGRLCLLRRSVPVEQITQLFLCTPAVGMRTSREIERAIRRIPVPARFPKEFAWDLAEAVRETIEEASQQAALAGPDDVFRQSVVLVVEEIWRDFETTIEDDLEELIRLYGKAGSDFRTEERSLSRHDQERLPEWIARYNELRSHPLLPFSEQPAALEQAFIKAGWSKAAMYAHADVTPADVVEALRWVKLALWQCALEHRARRRVLEQCKLYQEKWRASGPLATLEPAALSEALSGLVRRHLALREADDRISVHPAVRDYFGQSVAAPDRGIWHHLIGGQLISLVQRPGAHHPTDEASLDLVEEAIFHALQARQPGAALGLYTRVLGGHRHLAWKLGEIARGLRIIRGFDPCPDRWALGWYLRALGELEDAYEQNQLAYFRADVRLLQGRLSQVGEHGDPARAAIAEFLMGKTKHVPPDPLGCVIPRAQILLYLGDTARAWLSTEPEHLCEITGWEDDRARYRLFRAEAASRMGDTVNAKDSLGAATGWILHSGSAEHLCLYHLIRSRIARRSGELQAARHAADEGLHIARQCEFGLYLIELLCAQAELLLGGAEPGAAESSAREAERLASSADCQFLWGAAEAGHLLACSLLAMNRLDEARRMLEQVRSLRLRIGDVRVEQTDALITSVFGWNMR